MDQNRAPAEKTRTRYFLTGLAGFFLGFLVCLIWQTSWSFLPHFGFQWNTQKKTQQQTQQQEDPLSEVFKADPNADPFQQMQKLRQQMLQQALQGDPDEAEAQDQDSFHPPGAPVGVGEVTRREDGGFVYLDISIKGLDRQSLGVEVTDGQVNLKGQIHLKNEQNNGNLGEVIESFSRSFPAPEYTDTKKVEIENSQDTLTLKFPKKD